MKRGGPIRDTFQCDILILQNLMVHRSLRPFSFLTFLKKCICLWLHWVFVAAHGLSFPAGSVSYTPVAGHRLLTVVASLAVEPRL